MPRDLFGHIDHLDEDLQQPWLSFSAFITVCVGVATRQILPWTESRIKKLKNLGEHQRHRRNINPAWQKVVSANKQHLTVNVIQHTAAASESTKR